MCVVVPALIVDVLSLPYGALTLPLALSVISRADFVPDLEVDCVSSFQISLKTLR